MSEHDRLIDDDLAAWNAADPAARCCDPTREAVGHAVHGMVPGHRVTRRGAAA